MTCPMGTKCEAYLLCGRDKGIYEFDAAKAD